MNLCIWFNDWIKLWIQHTKPWIHWYIPNFLASCLLLKYCCHSLWLSATRWQTRKNQQGNSNTLKISWNAAYCISSKPIARSHSWGTIHGRHHRWDHWWTTTQDKWLLSVIKQAPSTTPVMDEPGQHYWLPHQWTSAQDNRLLAVIPNRPSDEGGCLRGAAQEWSQATLQDTGTAAKYKNIM